MSGKSAKIALAVFILVVAGLLARRALHNGTEVAAEANFVCVATGETFSLNLDQIAMIPAENPNTGERTLLPCSRSEDGVLRVGARYQPSLVNDLKEVNKYVDPMSLEVRLSNDS
jgi:hypothetical protein